MGKQRPTDQECDGKPGPGTLTGRNMDDVMHDEVVLDMESEERKVINEFCHLLEKSKQLFNGLRDMPQVVVESCCSIVSGFDPVRGIVMLLIVRSVGHFRIPLSKCRGF